MTVDVEQVTITPARPPRWRLVLHAGFGVLGVGAMVAMVLQVGPATLFGVLRRSAAFLPLVALIEVVRLASEVVGMRILSPRVRERVPLLPLIRAHIVSYAMSNVMPAGRVAAESTKAAMISRYVGAPHAAALAATNQSLALFAGASIAVTCAIGAYVVLGWTPVTWGCIVSACVTSLAFALVQIASRARSVSGLLGRFARLRAATASFQDALDEIPIFHPGVAAIWFGSRLLQTLELGLLVFAVGGPFTLGSSLLAEGVNVAGGAAGDFIPGQLGATDGAFALSASSLHLAMADAIAVALAMHFIQLAGTVIGALAPIWWRSEPPAPST